MTGVQTCALPIFKNADSANNLRLKLKLYRDGPAPAPTPAPAAAPTPPPAATRTQDAASWGLELKLEELPEETPPEDPGKHF